MTGARSISTQIPPDLLQALHQRAEQEDRSTAAVIRMALRTYLETDAPLRRVWGSRALAGQGTDSA
jgi:hypothetical protein